VNNELTERRKRGRRDSEVSLVAYGRNGDWEISVDQDPAKGSSGWYAQIVGPRVSIYAQIPDPGILIQVIDFLKPSARPDEPRADSLKIGSFANAVVELIRDTEFAGRFFLLVGNSGRSTIRFTISQSDVTILVPAIRQVVEDLCEEKLLS
jgi:hypothetical protein